METCETLNNNWGFSITDDNFKSPKEVIQLLVRTVGTGANLLLNVGPMPNGKIQPEFVERLRKVGEWMNKYGYTLYKTKQGFASPQTWGVTTNLGKTHYIHILDNKLSTLTLNIPGFQSAKALNIEQPVVTKNKKTGEVTFTFKGALDDIDSIIEVTVK